MRETTENIRVSLVSPLKLEKVVRPKTTVTMLLFLALLFILIGDRLLPEPLGTVSQNTRTSINQFLIGLFPEREPKDPYQRTEEAIKQQEQGQ
ncbi:hypothetical protein [Lyngbya aestuarii]|uniref:hypothetical protein n=1 Tax=Lyngbya aestuarii TaxID=118322 RepID=UPI00403D714A